MFKAIKALSTAITDTVEKGAPHIAGSVEHTFASMENVTAMMRLETQEWVRDSTAEMQEDQKKFETMMEMLSK